MESLPNHLIDNHADSLKTITGSDAVTGSELVNIAMKMFRTHPVKRTDVSAPESGPKTSNPIGHYHLVLYNGRLDDRRYIVLY